MLDAYVRITIAVTVVSPARPTTTAATAIAATAATATTATAAAVPRARCPGKRGASPRWVSSLL